MEVDHSSFYQDMYGQRSLVPNGEEAARWGAIIVYLATIYEDHHRKYTRPMRILDVGCGRGWIVHQASLFGHVEGIEPSEELVHSVRNRFPDLQIKAGTAGSLLKFPDFQPFDVVICSEVIEHIPDVDKSTFLAELHELLCSHGKLIISTPRANFFRRWHRNYGGQPIEEWLTEPELSQLIEKQGFRWLSHRRVYVPFVKLAPRVIRVCESPRVQRLADQFHLGWSIQLLRYVVSIYQIWYCERKT